MPPALPRIPAGEAPPPETIVLPSWLTPAFARKWLKAGGLATSPRGGQKFSQAERYQAISHRRDWDPARGWALVWREPYTKEGDNARTST